MLGVLPFADRSAGHIAAGPLRVTVETASGSVEIEGERRDSFAFLPHVRAYRLVDGVRTPIALPKIAADLVEVLAEVLDETVEGA